MTLTKKSMIPTSESVDLVGLKMVKNAVIFSENGVYYIRHYDTVIFAYNQESKMAEINKHCSMTSDRQIRSAIEFFNVTKENQIDVSDGSQKWRYSGDLRN